MHLVCQSRDEALAILLLLFYWARAVKASLPSSSQCAWIPEGPLSLEWSSKNICPAIVDDVAASQSGIWEPWASPPLCDHPPASQSRKSKYCVYTHTSFAGSHGMSIITTPAIAATVAPLVHGIDPAWTSSKSKWLSRTEPRDPAPYAVVDIPRKGKGVVATADIAKGELLFRERPVLVETMARPKYMGPNHQSKLLERAWARLPPSERDAVLGLSHHSGAHVLRGIMDSNTFGMTLSGVPHSGLFPRISRINHSCRPNVYVRYTRSTLELEVVAYRDISAGTELGVSYTPLNMLSRDRRQVLLGWGFNCTCQLCSAPSHILETSDANRQEVQLKLDELDEARQATPGGGRDTVERIMQETLALMDHEGMEAQRGDIYAIAAQVLLDMGDRDGAIYYGHMAVEALGEYAGMDSERTEEAVVFLDGLDEH
ncbi:hypothetical protein M0657_007004 [Pyricularia oryzae]|uniref:SET domain-containing protein n=2 Tax=Pyricularia oryzae TaxID=318829 RepID=A0AA97NME5_PYRO3|nr:hypothetical protein OOU_Y34scaffold01018g15 [Pyricularia oryzae Y34]KAI7919048.1 hypothetical protein M9X92_006565 [Pyricularia oryzae]KAI7919535.1 hypothetical protein M0657_007004 [Pyricularia oryzae]